jgi:hypothetical protein
MGLEISFNLRDIARRIAKAYDYLMHGRADPRTIACPVLCMAGEAKRQLRCRSRASVLSSCRILRKADHLYQGRRR